MGVFKPFLIPAKPDNQVLLFQHSKVNSSPRGKITFLSVKFFFQSSFWHLVCAFRLNCRRQ